MTFENVKYIFTVKNLLVLNTPMNEVKDILNDLKENAEENTSGDGSKTEKALLKDRFGSPVHFAEELKDSKKKMAFLETGICAALIIAVYIGLIYILSSSEQYIVLTQIQIPAVLVLLMLWGMYLWRSGDRILLHGSVMTSDIRSRKAFTITLTISSILCLPELYLTCIGRKQILEYGKSINYEWNAVQLNHIVNIFRYFAVIIITAHCLIIAIAAYRYFAKVEMFMPGVIIQNLTAIFATCWFHYHWSGMISDPDVILKNSFMKNWGLAFVCSIVFAILWYHRLRKH